MDLVVTLKTIFEGIHLLEVIAIFILTTAIIMVLLTTSVVTQLVSFAGILTFIIVLLFTSLGVRTMSVIFDGVKSNATINKEYIVNGLLNKVKEKKLSARSTLDDGSDITQYSYDKPLGRMKYSEAEVKNSLDKIYSNYGLDTIFYMQDVLLRAIKLQGSDEAIYIKLEDYAFICSMNICNKYLYDFNDVKKDLGGQYLVVVVPEFLSGLENYVP